MQQLTFSLEEPPVSPSVLQDSVEAFLTTVATWPSSIYALLTDSLHAGLSGKTSPASCLQEEDGTLVPSLGRWSNSGMGSPTECWTLSSSEWPSDADVCLLSDIVETGDVPQQYFLSPRACAGILLRAERRGKELPQPLFQALHSVAQGMSE